jgi:hypothetical protein
VLVTNQLQFTRHADRVLYMQDGCIQEAGTYAQLMAAGGGFAKLMAQTEVLHAPQHLWGFKLRLKSIILLYNMHLNPLSFSNKYLVLSFPLKPYWIFTDRH